MVSRTVSPHFGRHLTRAFTRGCTASRYDTGLVRLVMNRSLDALDDLDWKRWQID